jgi:hypothetical protein
MDTFVIIECAYINTCIQTVCSFKMQPYLLHLFIFVLVCELFIRLEDFNNFLNLWISIKDELLNKINISTSFLKGPLNIFPINNVNKYFSNHIFWHSLFVRCMANHLVVNSTFPFHALFNVFELKNSFNLFFFPLRIRQELELGFFFFFFFFFFVFVCVCVCGRHFQTKLNQWKNSTLQLFNVH